jgi:hypothetical protein
MIFDGSGPFLPRSSIGRKLFAAYPFPFLRRIRRGIDNRFAKLRKIKLFAFKMRFHCQNFASFCAINIEFSK